MDGREFPETHWSQLLELRDPDHPRRAEHLERLAGRYWKPVYHYVRALRRATAGDAEDLTQQFFAMLLARKDLERLSPDRGSFRGFLKTAVRNFLVSADRAAAARSPRDGAKLFPYEEAEAAWRAGPELPPDQAFDREWARGVLLEAAGLLRQALAAEGHASHYEIFRAYCLEEAAVSYRDLAERHGMSEDDVRNRLREMRQRIRQILRDLLRSYLLPGEDVEAELRFVLSK